MRSERDTRSRSWLTRSVVRPRAIALRPSVTARAFSSSRPVVGSSRIRMDERRTAARASAIRWRWPPDSVTPRSPSIVSYPLESAPMKPCALARSAAAPISPAVARGAP